MNDTLTSILFPATAATGRTVKAHWLNMPTYFYIVAIILLTATIAAIDWAIEQLDRFPEYVIICKLAKVRTQRRFVQLAIKVETVRLSIAPHLVAAMDRVFCLN